MSDDRLIIGIVSGYFDPIHVGHIEYLKLAKVFCDHLVCIVNNDNQTVAKNGRILIRDTDRLKILSAIKYVDEVFLSIDNDGSVCRSITAIAQDYLTSRILFLKGGDRFKDEIPEYNVCTELGIKIIDSVGNKIDNSSRIRKEMLND